MGWVLTGHQSLADTLIAEASRMAKPADLGSSQTSAVAWAFRVYDAACSSGGVVRFLRPVPGDRASLATGLRSLQYEQRVAVAFILLEDMDASTAAAISGRSQYALERDLERALAILSDATPDD